MIRAALLRFGRRNFFLFFGTLLLILGAKFALISTYGSELPFWDQWDAEGDSLYLSAAHGNLGPVNFFAPHNEHRIVFTKLLAVVLEKSNGEWDARLEMTVNAFVHLAAIAVLLLMLKAMVDQIAWRVSCILAAILFCVPLAWENTLGGFQSQFYFLALFSLLHIAGSFLAATPRQRWTAQIAGACAILSMGSGFFSAIAVLVCILLKAGFERKLSREDPHLLAANIALILLGAALHVEHAEHAPLRVQNVGQFLTGLESILAWPASNLWVSALALFSVIFVFANKLRVRPLRAADVGWCALVTWWVLQVIATVIARGNTMVLSPRYLDLFAIGVIVIGGAWATIFLSHRLHAVWKGIVIIAAATWLFEAGAGIDSEWTHDRREYFAAMPQYNAQRIATVRDFILTHSDRFYRAQPYTQLPYPSAERLGGLLSDDGLVAVLPDSVRSAQPSQEKPWLRRVAEIFLQFRIGLMLLGLTFQVGALAAILARGLLPTRSANLLPSESTPP